MEKITQIPVVQPRTREDIYDFILGILERARRENVTEIEIKLTIPGKPPEITIIR